MLKKIDGFEKHLTKAKKKNSRTEQAHTYKDLGNAYQSLGKFQEAINYHNKDLSIAQEVGDRAGAVSYTHLTLPTIYSV